MKFLSVCSGIEAASAAWGPLGWKAVAFSEIEPFPCAVLAHHYPDTPNWGDMTNYEEWPDVSIDLLCGGTPCQSFSVAGLRGGLADARGNLMLTFGAIAAKYRPRWLVWENVPGVLSSNEGRDFAEFLGLITGQAVSVPPGGWQNSGIVHGIDSAYGAAYRVLDAQFFGVPQRRRRVFVVGHLGDWRRAAAVLFERHSLSGHPAPRRETGQTVTPTVRAGAANGGAGHGARSGDSKDELIVPVAQTLRAQAQAQASHRADTETYIPTHVGQAMSAKWSKGTAGPAGPAGDEHHNLLAVPAVTHSLRGDGFDASEDGTGRGTPLVPVLPFDTTQVTSAANRSNPKPGDPCHPLAAGMHPPAIAFQERGRESGRNLEVGGEIAYALTAPKDGGRAQERNVLTPAMQVRRLTPEECEALQGFPRSYTAVPYRGKPAADGPRYKALGNSWAVPCAAWIGRRIEEVESLIHPINPRNRT